MNQNSKKEIALERLRFFIQEVALGFILILVCLLIPTFLIPVLVGKDSLLYTSATLLSRSLPSKERLSSLRKKQAPLPIVLQEYILL